MDVMRLEKSVDGEGVQLNLDADRVVHAWLVHHDAQRGVLRLCQQARIISLLAYVKVIDNNA